MKDKFAIIISSVAILFSAFALCRTYPAANPLDFDYAGIITGILSLLVTILIGWQILNAVTIKNDVNKMEELFNTLQKSCQEAVNTVHENATKRIDEGLKLVRDMSNRNMEALSTLILLLQNQGIASALNAAIEMIITLKDERGFIYNQISEAIFGFICDIIGSMNEGINAPLVDCIRIVPKKRFNLLYSLDFTSLGWDESKINMFIGWLDYISAQYPLSVVIKTCDQDSSDKHPEGEQQHE